MFDRRQLLFASAGALAASAVPATTAHAAKPKGEHAGHGDHTGHAMPTEPPHGALIDAITGCHKAGEYCRQHCLELFATGDTSMAECSVAVADMLAVCAATRTLAVANSPLLPELRVACKKACTRCEEVCREHAAHHAACKACADACAAVLKVV